MKPIFQPTWESLQQYHCPQWFQDAKFGIWAHWGPQAVPEAGDWYARNMYIEGSDQYKYHLENYGHPSKYGFKDIIQLWKAEKFDPEGLIQLYKQAGARYFTAMAVHHDNFDCWNSTHHRWNAVQFGPQRDIVGAWRDAALKHGLRFGVTEHLERSWSWFNTNKGSDKQGPLAGVPYDGADPAYADLYFEAHDDSSYAFPRSAPKSWQMQWLARIQDLIEQYHPDLLYTDGAVPFGEVGRQMLASFYNHNIQQHSGSLEAVYNLKDMREYDRKNGTFHGEFMPGIGVLDMERGVVDGIQPDPWQTDTCIGGWFYNKFIEYKSAETVIHMLIDIVSKNGNLLLNFPLKPDGTLDEKSQEVVKGITTWMQVNHEAIYATRPWQEFGEGPTQSSGGLFNEDKIVYTPSDYRYTRKDEALYVFALGQPQEQAVVKLLGSTSELWPGEIHSVEMLGSQAALEWERRPGALVISLPEQKPCAYAQVFKIQ